MRLVIDSNVWVSAIVFGGIPRELFRLIVHDAFSVLIAPEILSEIRRIFDTKFAAYRDSFEALYAELRHQTTLVHLSNLSFKDVRDPNDAMILETALSGDAEYIVSGDKDLLVLHSFHGCAIVSPQQMVTVLGGRTA